ncbi:MAG: septal ring lytic transglycosylase RlpA family protein [Alphaproteobacteria bacterium]|nr:MAG: septal ring lytic transglycosylase RlpA family protein [Alphaproteobacteria bacterium]
MTRALIRFAVIALPISLLLAACGSTSSHHAGYGSGGTYKVGNPYKVAGRWYHPKEDPDYDRVGIASWYGPKFHGKRTANGEIYNMHALTAAHTTLPMPSFVRVTNLENGRSVILKVNDRGPFVGDRIIDVSRRAAQLLGFEKQGTARVRVQAVPGPEAPPAVQLAAARRMAPPAGQPTTPAPRDTVAPSPPAVPVVAVEAAAVDPPSVAVDPAGTAERVYIQAGAFSAYLNARRVAEGLEKLGRVELAPVSRDGRYIYRVRVGPLASMGEANNLLNQVMALGHDTARIVVD